MALSISQLSYALNALPIAGFTLYQGKNGQVQDGIARWDVRGEKLESVDGMNLEMCPSLMEMHSGANLLQEYFPFPEGRYCNRTITLRHLKGDSSRWQIRLTVEKESLQYDIRNPFNFFGPSLPFVYDKDKRLFIPDD